MGIMTNRNACRGKSILVLVILAALAGFQPGFSEDQDIEQLRQAAERGESEAQLCLGTMYGIGKGVPEHDREAAKWYREAAEQGVAEAQYALASMYRVGEGVPKDDRRAAKWYREAAEQGAARAQYNLGDMYTNGTGVPESSREAAKWYRLAAEQGLAAAQYSLGFAYAYGHGVPQDYVTGYAWINLAAARGNVNAVETKDLLWLKMTSEQVVKAQNLTSKVRSKVRERIQASKGAGFHRPSVGSCFKDEDEYTEELWFLGDRRVACQSEGSLSLDH